MSVLPLISHLPPAPVPGRWPLSLVDSSLASTLAAEESDFIRQETAAVVLLAIAAGVAVVAKRIKFPYTVALVIAGFGAVTLGELVAVDVSPELILALLVPPLLFEATLHLPWSKLRADLVPVTLLALVGTGVGTVGLGYLVNAALGIPLPAAFAFGALISATDPVAVIAFFKSLGTPKRLSVLVEGESLFNDAVAVVAFTLAVDVAGGGEFTLLGAAGDFVVVSAGGLAIGIVLGYLVGAVFLARVDDALIETSTTLALAYGSFLLAEEFGLIIGQDDFHLSGILAVVAAGLMVGTVGLQNTSPTTRLTLEHFWELLTFLVNSMVFLVIGLTIQLSDLTSELGAVAVALIGVVVIRVALVYGLSSLSGWILPRRYIPRRFRQVMAWGGLRGAISLALVLTMTTEAFEADTVRTVQVMTFGVVLFTLLIQGTTISAVISRLGLSGLADNEREQQRHQARIAMRRAGQTEIGRLGAEGILFADMADALGRTYQRDLSHHSSSLRSHFRAHPELEASMLVQARRDALVAERSALADVVRSGLVEEQVSAELAVELNNRLAALDLIEDRWEAGPVAVGASGDDAELVLDAGDATDDDRTIAYVSWGGTGQPASLRRALRHASAGDRPLHYLAVLDDDTFGDLDRTALGLVVEELEWLLDAQLDLVRRQLDAEDLEVRVDVESGDLVRTVVAEVTRIGATDVLIGVPLPPSTEDTVAAICAAVTGSTSSRVVVVGPEQVAEAPVGVLGGVEVSED
jgi:CPA1 family monovalent cation:H+ antiporter